jgi:hypothetical protein
VPTALRLTAQVPRSQVADKSVMTTVFAVLFAVRGSEVTPWGNWGFCGIVMLRGRDLV